MSSSFLNASAPSNARVTQAAPNDFLCEAFDSTTIRALEQPLLDMGIPLMRTAAAAVAATARVMLVHSDITLDQADIVVLAGGGDNGADGLYAAAELAKAGASVSVVAVGRSLHPEGLEACLSSGVEIIALDPHAIIPGCVTPADAEESAERLDETLSYISSSHLIIDAMTGIGLQASLRGIPAAIAYALGEDGTLPDSPALPLGLASHDLPLVLAVDTPSGVGIDDGSLPGGYIPADVTVTFGAPKPCAMLPPAAYVCGQVVVVDFGFDTEHVEPAVRATSAERASSSIRLPHISDSKYSRGVVGLVTGSQRYPGAAIMSSKAASETNVGMIRYVGPERAENMVIAALPEAVTGKGHVQSWVLGSGVNAAGDDQQRRQIQNILHEYDTAAAEPSDAHVENSDSSATLTLNLNTSSPVTKRSVSSSQPYVIADAGALSLLPEHVTAHVILTPHAGELAALLSSRGEDVSATDVQAEPLKWAVRAWELTGATVLLKGAISLVIVDDGVGNPCVITSGFAPVWTGTAGSGDVLAGIIGALVAQNADDLGDNPDAIGECVAAGAYIHGAAAELAAGSCQRGWSLPLLCDPHHAREYVEQLGTLLAAADTRSAPAPLGHPILATDIIAEIGVTLSTLIDKQLHTLTQRNQQWNQQWNDVIDDDDEDDDENDDADIDINEH